MVSACWFGATSCLSCLTLTQSVPVLSSGLFQVWRVSDPLQPHPAGFSLTWKWKEAPAGLCVPCRFLVLTPLFSGLPCHVSATSHFSSVVFYKTFRTYSWPLNNVGLSCTGPLTHIHFCQMTCSVQTHLFKGQLAVGIHVCRMSAWIMRGFCTALAVGAANFCVIQGSSVLKRIWIIL